MNKAAELINLPNCLPIGTRISEFEIRQVIGEGGFGIVYLAFDHSLQRTVAIKEYMPSALAARSTEHTVSVRSKRHAEAFEAGLRSFINEARLLAQFDHPALVKVYRFWEQHGTAYMVMRYYEGRTLKSVLRDNPELVNEAWLKRLLKPILSALDKLYAASILHRDVSPENIMIQPDGKPVLLDFGAARQIVQDMAQSLTVILKPGFAPVEQYADDESMRQGPWTDIYSLSAVMYAAITGKAPPAAVARMLNDPIEPLAISGREGYGTQFLEAIDRGMAVRPEIRPQTIAEFAILLGLEGVRQSRSSSKSSSASAAPVAAGAAAPAAAAPASDKADKPARAADVEAPAPAPDGTQGSSADKAAPLAADADKRASRSKADAKPVKPARQAASAAAAGVIAVRARPSNTVIGAGVAALALLVGGIAWFADGSPVAPAATQVASAEAQLASQSASASAAASEGAGAAQAAAGSAVGTVPAQAPVAANATAPQQAAAASAPATASTAKAAAGGPAASAGVPNTATAAAEPSAPTSGTVSIAVQPWATIYVDGVQKGITPPLKKLTLPLGEHEIRLENPNFPVFVHKVTVDARKPVTIKHDFGA
ncbi:protein kinase [Pseudoduganella eburnea]|uniref:non-specific serine/threonine protein kinase n=1 Tax=Massilia eburnea TaxID=1776165 RepID=A0A6L6QK46_9BURK|nr:serine/threonine-protein kinase [Massilia eburnea]MTW12565.1 protein kinase [Massilia eburnea]